MFSSDGGNTCFFGEVIGISLSSEMALRLKAILLIVAGVTSLAVGSQDALL